VVIAVLLAGACSGPDPEEQTGAPEEVVGGAPEAPNPVRNAYFGDLHVHSRYSFDAFIFATRATPDDAYRYAKGEAIDHPSGYQVRLEDGPLDFYAVTDHAMFLGMLPAMADPSTEVSKLDFAKAFQEAETIDERRTAFQGIRPYLGGGRHEGILDLDVVRSAWSEIVASAERHNDPGKFTTFIAYEYTSGPESQNLHRNVIFRGSRAPELPFSRLDSMNPEDLWAWMDGLRAAGMEALAIPHNSNGSNGQMFELETFDGDPLDAAWAETRIRNEPLVEITQVKGNSDTHPALSPNDEWADFEIFPYRIATWIDSEPKGSYVREALLNGLELESSLGVNPYRFGLIGSSDTHTGATSVEEDNFFSKVGLLDGTAQARGSVPLDEPGPNGETYAEVYYRLWSASGLAGVWAEENTREAIYDAFRRKETFATTGPRMRVRLFAGFDYDDALLAAPDLLERAYAGGVPMGGELLGVGGAAPRFVVQAVRGPNSAPLARLQVIKGWLGADGQAAEQVFDVACSDGATPDAQSHRCPDNGASVDLSDCSISSDVGANELEALWSDPGFDPAQPAFYYVRALQNPTCRWSTWDAVRAGVEPHPDLHRTLQERAWSSPIWYRPES
jgi:hypothetical protein